MADNDTGTTTGGDSTDQQRDAAVSSDASGTTAATTTTSSADDDTAGLKKALHAERTRAGQLEKRLKAIEDSQKSDLEKANERAEIAEKERDALRSSVLRSRVAAKHDLPAELADRLQGDDEAALEEDAKRLAALVTPMGDMGARRGGGNGGAGGSADDMNAQIRAKAGR